MARHINDAGLALIQQWEGLFLKAYHGAADRPGLLTIGYGHTDAAGPPVVKEGMTITKEQASAILRTDLGRVEANVSSMVKVPLNDNQYAAMVSFVFNCGEANFAKSSLLRKLNASDYTSVPTELMKWTKANGVQVHGLVNRRAAEAGLWAKGSHIASQYIEPEPAPASSTDTVTKVSRATIAVAGGGTLATQVTSAINGPVTTAVEQVKQVIDSSGDVVDTTKAIVAKTPDGTWQHIMSVVQSPKFLTVMLVIVLAAWALTWYLRTKAAKEAAT